MSNKTEKDQALIHVQAAVQFAYEQGFHELGYDPVAVLTTHSQSIDTPEFRELLSAFKNSTLGFDYNSTVKDLITYLDNFKGAAQ